MTTPLLRNRRHPGLPLASRLGRDSTPIGDWIDDTVNTAASTVTSLSATAAGTSHTKGSWVEIVASTTEDAVSLAMNTSAAIAANATDTRCLVDIGIGSAGSEVVVIPDIAVGNKFYSIAGWLFPIFIPKGTRVAFRSQHAQASNTNSFRFRLGRASAQSIRPASYCVNMGANTSTSSGVVSTWGGAPHTKGSWSEITSAAPEPLSGLQVCVDHNGVGVASNGSVLIDIGVGSAGSETVIASNMFYVTGASEWIDNFGGGLAYIPARIPTGQRIAVRHQSSVSNASTLGVVLIGIPARGR